MEHRLITGGAQFLPFARSCVQKLKKTGLRYASQTFVIGAVTVNVRLSNGHEFIKITESGGLMAGVVRGGIIVADKIRMFKPTLSAWQGPLKKSQSKFPLEFREEELLAIPDRDDIAIPRVYEGGSQYGVMCSSMYSGKMRKVVQALLGMSTVLPINIQKREIRYNCMWEDCHGIVTGEDGKLWLTQISRTKGVLLMPLPYNNAEFPTSSTKEIRELLNGLPSGATFPADPTMAIYNGTILQPLTALDMDPYFSKKAYSPYLGWSFNESGSEAHNTCYSDAVPTAPTGHHFKLSFTIGPVNPAPTHEQPIATVSVTLTEVASGSIQNGGSINVGGGNTAQISPMSFYQGEDIEFSMVLGTSPGAESAIAPYKTPIFVCHINNVLETVYAEFTTPHNTDTGIPSQTIHTVWVDHGACASSTKFPDAVTVGGKQDAVNDYQEVIGTFTKITTVNDDTSRIADYELIRHTYGPFYGQDRLAPTAAIWPMGTRDAYIFYQPSTSSGTMSIVSTESFWTEVAGSARLVPREPPNTLPPSEPSTTSGSSTWAITTPNEPTVHLVISDDAVPAGFVKSHEYTITLASPSSPAEYLYHEEVFGRRYATAYAANIAVGYGARDIGGWMTVIHSCLGLNPQIIYTPFISSLLAFEPNKVKGFLSWAGTMNADNNYNADDIINFNGNWENWRTAMPVPATLIPSNMPHSFIGYIK